MNRLPDRLPGRVEMSDSKNLLTASSGGTSGADSIASETSSLGAMTRVGRAALERLASLLTEREFAIVQSVVNFRYMTGAQLLRLHFAGHASHESASRTARRVLERLVGARLLQRTSRRIGGERAGSSSYVYGIGPLGHRLLGGAGSRGRWKEPSVAFLDHTLAIGDIAISCVEGERTGDFEILVMQPEPASWRTFTRGLGTSVVLKPDLFLVLGIAEFEDRWFVEIDRGTESLTAIRQKAKTYGEYYAAGIEQREHEVFPRVLWVGPSDKRVRDLRGALTANIFQVATAEQAVALLRAGGES